MTEKDMKSNIIQNCSSCGLPFTAYDLIHDPKLEIIGMTARDKIDKAFYYYNHVVPGCQTTFLVKVIDLAQYIDEYIPAKILAESSHCQSHCAKIDDYQACDNDCSFAPFRRFLLRMREIKIKAAEAEKVQKSQ